MDALAVALGLAGPLALGLSTAVAWIWGREGARRFLLWHAGLPAPGGGRAGGPGVAAWLRRTAVGFLVPLNERWIGARLRAWLGALLGRAGHPGELTPAEVVSLGQLGCAVGLGLGVFFALSLRLTPLLVPALALLGCALPLISLRDKVRARARAIVRALPFALDLLTLSVEAGLDFSAALAKVVEKGRRGPLADELSLVLRELRLGKTREEALRNLAARVELPAVASFVRALVQADRMGTPLGTVLRILCTQMRAERTQRAEKLANEAPLKLLFPLICFIFPTVFLILFGPIAYQIFLGGP